jgi:hypothetical protein
MHYDDKYYHLLSCQQEEENMQRLRRASSIRQSTCRWLESVDYSNSANGVGLPTDVDAIIVLGGGQDRDAQHMLPLWATRRLDTAADLLSMQKNTRCSVLISGGGPLLSLLENSCHASTQS